MSFFDDPEALQRLRDAAAIWDRTPFREHGRVKGLGGGIDCVGYVEELMIAAGVAERGDLSFARTDADYQSHRTWLRILDYLRGKVTDDPQSARLAAIFEEIMLPAPQGPSTNGRPLRWENPPLELFKPGDLLVLRDEGQIHLPVILRGRKFTHCMRPNGVDEGSIHDTSFSNHFIAMFRARAR